jgi:hypothetical protein
MPGAEYPCWIYDPSGVNPPILVPGDDQFVALLTAPIPDPGPRAIVPSAPVTPSVTVLPIAASTLTKVNGVTDGPSAKTRFGKSPTKGH